MGKRIKKIKKEMFFKIRGHHLLCLLNFRGRGYSRGFVKNMEKVAKKLHKSPTFPIIITDGSDIICSACPYNNNGRCSKNNSSDENVRDLDLKIINIFGLRVGGRMRNSLVFEKIKKEIYPEDLTEICRDCEWVEYCSKFKKFKE